MASRNGTLLCDPVMWNARKRIHFQQDTYRALSWPSSGSGHLPRRWILKQLWQYLLWLPKHKRQWCYWEAASYQHGVISFGKHLLNTDHSLDSILGSRDTAVTMKNGALAPRDWCSSSWEADSEQANNSQFHKLPGGEQCCEADREVLQAHSEEWHWG